MTRKQVFLFGTILSLILMASNLRAQDAPVKEDSSPASAEKNSDEANGAATVDANKGPDDPAAASATELHSSAQAPSVQDLKTADESYDVKIRGMEEKVNELKEKIFRSKARLLALQEMVFTGVSTGARAVIVHRNEMGSSFRLREMHYFIDGAPLKQEVDETGDALNAKDEIQLFSGNIVPGNHQITVNLTYQGHGFGVFSYLNGYTFHVKSSYTFKAQDGKETLVKVVAYEKGGFTTELKDRPDVRYDIEVKKNRKRTKSDKSKQTDAETGQ